MRLHAYHHEKTFPLKSWYNRSVVILETLRLITSV
uniref:Uncharacterized protein n=1 Tax=Rhizophora mucronata TaxID=61149 RepID=A0A2P2PP33_RHIMU